MFAVLVWALIGANYAAFHPQVVHAETYSWTEDTSKQGLDGFYICTGTASFEGNTASITHNVGPDVDRIDNASTHSAERAWQVRYCERITREDVVNVFHYKWGTEIDPSSVKISGAFH